MVVMEQNFEERKVNLKRIRDKILRFHKILMDNDREVYEREFGTVSPGKFLELLLSDERFAWLRTISTFIVRIDEAFDLDDGVSAEMVEGFYTEANDMFNESSDEYQQFNDNLNKSLPNLPEAAVLKDEIVNLLK